MSGGGELSPPKLSPRQSGVAFPRLGLQSHALNGTGLEHRLRDSSSDDDSSGASEGEDNEENGTHSFVFVRSVAITEITAPIVWHHFNPCGPNLATYCPGLACMPRRRCVMSLK